MPHAEATRLLEYEAQALLERLTEVRPFALTLPMVPAASPSVAAQAGIEAFLSSGRQQLRRLIGAFLDWLRSPEGAGATAAEAQQRFTSLRLRFLSIITQFDVFADALAERSQHAYGEFLAGLDVLATEALELPANLFETPPIICHLDRGAGAAIRRARTRLPGGGTSPVAIIRVPRERMVGSAIASSLVHEVGHQGAELLGLVGPLQEQLDRIASQDEVRRVAWYSLARWISEIVADLWSVARLGITATVGLIGVVSLPKTFVTSYSLDGPHPTPWIRVKISIAFGRALYPNPQWGRLDRLWSEFYPLDQAHKSDAAVFRLIEGVLPEFVRLVLSHRGSALGGECLRDVFPTFDRTPERLRELWRLHTQRADALAHVSPTLSFACVGQARFDGQVAAPQEARLLRKLLRYWALRTTVNASEVCSIAQRTRGVALAV